MHNIYNRYRANLLILSSLGPKMIKRLLTTFSIPAETAKSEMLLRTWPLKGPGGFLHETNNLLNKISNPTTGCYANDNTLHGALSFANNRNKVASSIICYLSS